MGIQLAQAPAKTLVRKKVTRSKVSAKSKRPTSKANARKRTVVKRANTARSAQGSAVAISHLFRGLREITAIALLATSIIFLLALLSFDAADPGWSHTGMYDSVRNAGGIAGAWFSDVAFSLFGFVAFFVPIMLGFVGWLMFYEAKPENINSAPYLFVRLIGFIIMMSTACGLADLHFAVREGNLPMGVDGGGLMGTLVASQFVEVLGALAATLMMLALFLGSFSLATMISWLKVTEMLGAGILRISSLAEERLNTWWSSYRDYAQEQSELRSERQELKEASREERQQQRVAEREQRSLKREENRKQRMAQQKENHEKHKKLIRKKVAAPEPEPTPVEAPAPATIDDKVKNVVDMAKEVASKVVSAPPATPAVPSKPVNIKQKATQEKPFKTIDNSAGESTIPPISMLDEPREQSVGFTEDELENLSRLIEERLADFKVIAEVVAVQPGPVITQFEIDLAPGTKASKISGLSRDIARSLSLVSVRVVEVIPGKSTIGLEIPNQKREIVGLSGILASKKFLNSKSPLTMALGKGIGGQPVIADLAKMPHLLVAGTTGSGKSVGINTMLVSLLYKSGPDKVRLILIDPKMLELNVYEDIPHLLSPVVTDMKEAANALRWCVGEMERRYKIMAAMGVRNISGFNKKIEQAIKDGEPIPDPLYNKETAFDPDAPPPMLESLPYIVVVVDEFADMIMVVGKKVEELIARIAQKARAAGIHLVLATQRPSTDVITGLIKSNIPTRMAFQVSTKLDSRIVLDQGGAESLLGHGDMLYLPPGTGQAERVHGAFIDDHEVHNVVGYIKEHGEANYISEILDEPSVPIPGLSGDFSGDSDSDKDALYDQAVAIVTETRKASISYVQRRLKIGYNRSARMIEEMEEAGVISQVQSNGQREVLAPPPVGH